MFINQVSYQKTFNLGNYSSERIGVEIGLEAGEDAMEALETAKRLTYEFHQKGQLQINPEYAHHLSPPNFVNFPSTAEPLPTIQVSNSQPQVREQTLEEQIRSCTDVTVLKAYQLLVKKDPILQKAYDDTMSTIKFHKM